jgi:hypothetical protein
VAAMVVARVRARGRVGTLLMFRLSGEFEWAVNSL